MILLKEKIQQINKLYKIKKYIFTCKNNNLLKCTHRKRTEALTETKPK